jgi:hypothetical protein
MRNAKNRKRKHRRRLRKEGKMEGKIGKVEVVGERKPLKVN